MPAVLFAQTAEYLGQEPHHIFFFFFKWVEHKVSAG